MPLAGKEAKEYRALSEKCMDNRGNIKKDATPEELERLKELETKLLQDSTQEQQEQATESSRPKSRPETPKVDAKARNWKPGDPVPPGKRVSYLSFGKDVPVAALADDPHYKPKK